MTNLYFTAPSDLAPATKARSVDINAITQAVNTAFDKLPAELSLKNGTVGYAQSTTTTTDNVYTIALDAAITQYADGLRVTLLPMRDNTGACTLNINGLGAIAIKRADGSAPAAGDLLAASPLTLVYVASTNTFRLPPLANAQVTASAASATAAAASATAAAASAGSSAGSANASGNSATASASSAASSAASANASAASAAAAAASAQVSKESLASIAQQFHTGAIVDVFLYDTSRDSDGGAWRKRCKHTSWESETLVSGKWLGQFSGASAAFAAGGAVGDYFQASSDGLFYQITSTSPLNIVSIYRGNTREFPALALIVAESARVVIYDATQPTMPMWMVFAAPSGTQGIIGWASTGTPTLSSVYALNGIICVGGDGQIAAAAINFVSDIVRVMAGGATFQLTSGRRIVDRNAVTTFSSGGDGYAIVSSVVNDIAMILLPDAPMDPATGLPTPTIAVATTGGISVIKHDGTIVNSAFTSNSTSVNLSASTLYFTRNAASEGFNAVAISGIAASFSGTAYTNSTIPATGVTSRTLPAKNWVASGGAAILSLLKENPATPVKGMVAYLTNAFNSGWQVGDSRGAWLADTVAETLTASGELVTNGTFDTDTSGWTLLQGAGGGTIAVSAAALKFTQGASSAFMHAYQQLTTVIGRVYLLAIDVPLITTSTAKISVGTSAPAANADYSGFSTTGYGGAGKRFLQFTATATTTYLVITDGQTAASVSNFDNVSVKLVDPDRSVKSTGLIVNGSITKSAVATGAQMVGYSGFSAANYLEQQHTGNLDFGTGTFAFEWWASTAQPSTDQCWFEYGIAPFSSGWLNARVLATTGQLKIYISDGTNNISITSTNSICDGRFHRYTVGYDGTNLRMFQDGVEIATAVARGSVGTLTNASSTLRAGCFHDSTGGASNVTMSLLRATATWPSNDQMAQMYRDELALFQANAKCTIDGTSSSVTAIDYDDVTDLVHVGTSWGRSAFKGLQRTESGASTIGAMTAVSTRRGSHISGGASGARFVEPTVTLRDELLRKDEARRAMQREEIPMDFDGIAAQTLFTLPIGFTTKNVFVTGTKKRLGSTKDYTTSFDGYRETVVFGAAPGAVWVQITANRSI